MNDVTVFERLKKEDLQEKVGINLKKDMSLKEIKLSLLDEKHMFERNVLRQQVQIQNLTEQLAYVDYLITDKSEE